MKHPFLTIATCALLLLAAGCKKDEPQPAPTFVGNVAQPVWTAPAEHDYTASMTAVIAVDLKAQYPDIAADFVRKDDDRLAAFAGDRCLGVAGQTDGLFFLYVTAPDGESGSSLSNAAVTLRYWSAFYTNLFESPDAFTFSNDAHLGTIDQPFTPAWTEVKGEK